MVKDIGISKSKIYFNVKLANVLEKSPKLKNSSLLLNFMKNYKKSIKHMCKESGNEFK